MWKDHSWEAVLALLSAEDSIQSIEEFRKRETNWRKHTRSEQPNWLTQKGHGFGYTWDKAIFSHYWIIMGNNEDRRAPEWGRVTPACRGYWDPGHNWRACDNPSSGLIRSHSPSSEDAPDLPGGFIKVSKDKIIGFGKSRIRYQKHQLLTNWIVDIAWSLIKHASYFVMLGLCRKRKESH